MKRNDKPERLVAQKHKEKKTSPEDYEKRKKKKKRIPDQKIKKLPA